MTDDSTAVVRARNLQVAFGDVVALDGLDVTAPAGAVTAVLGPNGAGKTTFVRAVATLQRYDAGVLEVAGSEVAQAPEQVRGRIGLAGQQAAVVAHLTGRENLRLVARLFGHDRRHAKASAERVIEALNLTKFADRRVATYSGGQRRRLDLGASLVGAPTLLLLDEPTAGLDPRSRNELYRLILDLPTEGTSVLLTTQYLEEAAELADHIVIIDQGRAVAVGHPTELRRATGTTSLTVRTGEPLPAVAAAAVGAALQAEVTHNGQALTLVGSFTFDDAAAAIRFAGITPTELMYRPPTLDEVFLARTSEQEEVDL